MIKPVIAAAIFLTAPSAALADWQGTNWAMTRQQVIAATGASPVDQGPFVQNAEIGAEGPYSALGHDFRARYYFGAGDVLRAISLTLTDVTQCRRLLADLTSIYGDPVEKADRAYRWLDVGNNNEVLLNEPWPEAQLTDCRVYYRPISAGGDRGL